jgi:hypothetical protein
MCKHIYICECINTVELKKFGKKSEGNGDLEKNDIGIDGEERKNGGNSGKELLE